MNTQLPRWSWTADETGSNVSFVAMHDRSIDVILNNQRGEGFVKQVFRLCLRAAAKAAPLLILVRILAIIPWQAPHTAVRCSLLTHSPAAANGLRRRAANDENATHTGAPSWFSRDRVRLITQPVSTNTQPVEIDMWACWVMHKIDVRVKRRRRRAERFRRRRPPRRMRAPRSGRLRRLRRLRY